MLTVDEVAERLRLHPATVRRRVATGELEAVQLGGPGTALRIPSEALEEFVFGEPEELAP